MRDALRFEWVRLRTVRSTYWLIASALVVHAAVGLLVAFADRERPVDALAVVMVLTSGGAGMPLPVAGIFMAVLGILATGQEYRFGTIQPTLTTVPQRIRLLVAKVAVVCGPALLVGVVALVVNVGMGLVFWDRVPDLFQSPLDQVLPGFVLLTVLWAAVGVALGQLFRGVPGPLVVILVVPMIVENLVLRLSFSPTLDWLQPVARVLPFTAGQQLISFGGEVSGGDATEIDMLGRWPSASVFIAFVAAALVAAGLLLNRRDA
jgi:hypothetical protein